MDKMREAYTDKVDGRWWIFHWTPAGMIVRLMTNYPGKADAVHAIGMLGYREVARPKPETVADGQVGYEH